MDTGALSKCLKVGGDGGSFRGLKVGILDKIANNTCHTHSADPFSFKYTRYMSNIFILFGINYYSHDEGNSEAVLGYSAENTMTVSAVSGDVSLCRIAATIYYPSSFTIFF